MGKPVHRLQLCLIYRCGRLKLYTISHLVEIAMAFSGVMPSSSKLRPVLEGIAVR